MCSKRFPRLLCTLKPWARMPPTLRLPPIVEPWPTTMTRKSGEENAIATKPTVSKKSPTINQKIVCLQYLQLLSRKRVLLLRPKSYELRRWHRCRSFALCVPLPGNDYSMENVVYRFVKQQAWNTKLKFTEGRNTISIDGKGKFARCSEAQASTSNQRVCQKLNPTADLARFIPA